MKAARLIVVHVVITNLLSLPLLVALALWNGFGVAPTLLTLAILNLIHVGFAFGMAYERGLL